MSQHQALVVAPEDSARDEDTQSAERHHGIDF